MKHRIDWWRSKGFDVGSESIVADVGAGSGRNAIALSPYVGKIIAIDANQSVLPPDDMPENVTWVSAELPDHVVDTIQVDFLLCANVLEHVEPVRMLDFVRACRRMLKPGGGAFFSWASLYSNVGSHTASQIDDWSHLLNWQDADQWRSLLTSRFGEEFSNRWFRHEWRPGLSRSEWLALRESHTSLGDAAVILARVFEPVRHNMVCDDDSKLWTHCLRHELFEIAPSYHDLVCTSDTWLVRKERR